MPESINRCGELKTPPASIASICLNLSRHLPVCIRPRPLSCLEQDTTRKSFRLQLKVRARQYGLQEAVAALQALSIANGELGPRETFLLTRVVVFDIGVSGRLGRLDPGIQQRVPFR